jgi:predicted GIY-YIG superfamily endonuclease
MSGGYYLYLACCAKGTLYVGYTRNVRRRIAAHQAGHHPLLSHGPQFIDLEDTANLFFPF